METANQSKRAGRLAQAIAWLPKGSELPQVAWEARHRFVLLFVFAHAVGLAIFGMARGWAPWIALGEGGLIGAVGLVAAWPRLGRKFRSAAAAFGCVLSSAVFTQFWGGYIEGHFHFFVVLAVVALYQDWVPFLLAIGFVAVDHGLVGTLAPEWVYNHPAAIAHPWRWAVVHAVLVLAESAILIALWKFIEQARARADLVLQSAGEGILGIDLAGRVTFANPAAARMLGRDLDKVVNSSLASLLATPEGPAPTGSPLLVSGTGVPVKGRGSTVVGPGVRSRTVDWTLTVAEERGEVVGTVLTLADATERMRAEEEHSKRVQQFSELERLKELDRFKTLFINTAAHELHTPLTPLRLQVFALKEGHKGALNPQQLSTVNILERNVERLSSLVEDVLNVARLQASRMVLEREPTDVAELVLQATESFQDAAQGSRIRLEADARPGLWSQADAKRVSQVLYNLLDNALKFTPVGGRVRVVAQRHGDGIAVRVEDTGVGLSPADIERLFQPFSQVHSPMERTRAGSGLGLYISKGIVELHGGSIQCRSDGVGRGSVFEFILPAGDGPGPAAVGDGPAPVAA